MGPPVSSTGIEGSETCSRVAQWGCMFSPRPAPLGGSLEKVPAVMSAHFGGMAKVIPSLQNWIRTKLRLSQNGYGANTYINTYMHTCIHAYMQCLKPSNLNLRRLHHILLACAADSARDGSQLGPHPCPISSHATQTNRFLHTAHKSKCSSQDSVANVQST